jgi:hypothetical protein
MRLATHPATGAAPPPRPSTQKPFDGAMFNMMGSPYAMMESDAMVYAQPYQVRACVCVCVRVCVCVQSVRLRAALLWPCDGAVLLSGVQTARAWHGCA